MNHQLKITINVVIPHQDFSYEQQEAFIRATIGMFQGMFPSASIVQTKDGNVLSAITIENNEVEEPNA